MGNDTVLAFNRELAKRVGVNAALLYQELQRKYFYWKSQGKLKDDMFWCDQGALADWLLVSTKTISRAMAVLEEAGMITKKISYRPGTSTTTTWWSISETDFESHPENGQIDASYIKANTTADTGECGDDVIPMAAPTTPHVEVTIYDSDDNDKTITVKHQVSPKEWNKAVRKWRKDPAERVMMEFKDTGETEHMTFRRIKKYNVRPQTQSLGYDRNAGTAFGVSHD